MTDKKKVGFKHSDYFYNDKAPHQEGSHTGHPHNIYFHYGNKTFIGTQRAMTSSPGVR